MRKKLGANAWPDAACRFGKEDYFQGPDRHHQPEGHPLRLTDQISWARPTRSTEIPESELEAIADVRVRCDLVSEIADLDEEVGMLYLEEQADHARKHLKAGIRRQTIRE